MAQPALDTEFSTLAARLWGYGWQTKAARHLEVSDRTVRNWVSGGTAVPLWVMDRLRAMADIAPPLGSSSDMDRDAACVEAIEPALTDLRNRATSAGWHPAEVATALLVLTVSEIRGQAGDDATRQILTEAISQLAD